VNVLAVYLQSAGGFGSFGSFGSMGQLALPVIFIAALYFLRIAPNQKKQKAWQQMLSGLKSGDRVTTNGGLRGTVLQVKDDVVIVRIAPDNVKLEFVKSAIAAVTTEEKS
jgi:preprotein translocase subunit YajC